MAIAYPEVTDIFLHSTSASQAKCKSGTNLKSKLSYFCLGIPHSKWGIRHDQTGSGKIQDGGL